MGSGGTRGPQSVISGKRGNAGVSSIHNGWRAARGVPELGYLEGVLYVRGVRTAIITNYELRITNYVDWGLGFKPQSLIPTPQSPLPTSQSPIPNPQSPK
ncbi:MAG: hypothetical protein DSM106950_39315 [Stigonema ocellatum SAG 48.90 = DSM 106950]|nr:hypothetical protein [Stigonema ocellatum SAG 48.90 = DSM 106950]